MNLNHPEVKELINKWQTELREKTGENIILSAFIPHEPVIKLSIEKLKHIVCDATGITLDRLMHRSRYRRQVLSRQLVSFFAKEYLGYTLERIAAELNQSHHTTILISIRKIKAFMEIGDKEVCDLVEQISYDLKNYNPKDP